MNELWFWTLERLKKKNINRLISVADMLVALAACFGDLDDIVKERRHPLNAFLSLILAASISIITNLIYDIPLCYELKQSVIVHSDRS
jgi:hypothetical protein